MTVPRSPSLQSGLPLTHIFATAEKERQSLAETLQHVAEKYKGNMNFATIDAKGYGFFAEALGLALDRFPAVVIEDVINGETVPFDQDEEITADAIEKFVENYFSMGKTASIEIKVRRCRRPLLVKLLISVFRETITMNCKRQRAPSKCKIDRKSSVGIKDLTPERVSGVSKGQNAKHL